MEKKAVAVDIGGTNIRAGLVKNNKILRFNRKLTPKDKNNFLKMIVDMINEVKEEHIRGIGIACPGPLKNGFIINPPNIPLKNFDLKKFIERKFKVEVEVDNDAKCVALAELHLGCGKGRKNFFVLTLGTGIGGGVVINREVYNTKDIGTELGDIYLNENKTFEQLVGGKAIKRISKEKLGRELDISQLMKLKDRKAREIVEFVSKNLAKGIGSLINVFSPEIVVLAGGMREAGEKFLKLVRVKVKKYISLPKDYDIVWSKLQEPGLLGASLLVD